MARKGETEKEKRNKIWGGRERNGEREAKERRRGKGSDQKLKR